MMEPGERHLLVVDDDQRLRQLLQRFLAQDGYRVTVAADLLGGRDRQGDDSRLRRGVGGVARAGFVREL